MKRNEYMWVVLMEECAEVQQAAAKILRFGREDSHPDRLDETNEQQLSIEFYQLVAVMEELQEQQLIGRLTCDEINQIKKDKRDKVKHFLKYSQDGGFVE